MIEDDIFEKACVVLDDVTDAVYELACNALAVMIVVLEVIIMVTMFVTCYISRNVRLIPIKVFGFVKRWWNSDDFFARK